MPDNSQVQDKIKISTDRQKELLKYMSENIGITMEQAMKDLGYSESYAKSGHIKKTTNWKKLMRKYLPDRKIVKVIHAGLGANRKRAEITDRDDKGRPIYEYFNEPDHAVRHKFVETALKIKGKLVDRKDITSGGKPIPLLGGASNAISDNDSDEENS